LVIKPSGHRKPEDQSLGMTVIEKRSLALTSEEGSPGMAAVEDGASGIIVK
jgi:hypothetical protein